MDNSISFARSVKEEICSNVYETKDRLKALLAAYIKITGSLIFRDKKIILVMKNENPKIAKFIYETITEIYDCKAHIDYLNKGNTKTKIYQISVDDASSDIIDDLEISFLEGKISKNIVKNDDTISGYLAGSFLASGSINSPVTANYHLEIALNSENFAKWLSKLFGRYKNSNIEPRIIKRREKFVLYFKKSDQISDFLIMIGAVNCCMEFESVRVNRDFNNSANRLANSDMANMAKIVASANRQIDEIKTIDSIIGLDNIDNEKERELCYIRLQNDSSSLKELATLLSEKLECNISKSNVNHLLRKIHERYLRITGASNK